MPSPGTVSGVAVVYAQTTEISNRDGVFREVIAPRACEKALRHPNIGALVALRDHNPTLVLGRVRAKTLDVSDTPTGLRFTAKLPDTQLGRETHHLVGRGDLDGCSFGFTVAEDSWHADPDGTPVRVIGEIEQLWDVSVVTWPAYPTTSVSTGLAGRSGLGRSARIARLNDLRRRQLNEMWTPGPRITPPKWALAHCKSPRVRRYSSYGITAA